MSASYLFSHSREGNYTSSYVHDAVQRLSSLLPLGREVLAMAAPRRVEFHHPDARSFLKVAPRERRSSALDDQPPPRHYRMIQTNAPALAHGSSWGPAASLVRCCCTSPTQPKPRAPATGAPARCSACPLSVALRPLSWRMPNAPAPEGQHGSNWTPRTMISLAEIHLASRTNDFNRVLYRNTGTTYR